MVVVIVAVAVVVFDDDELCFLCLLTMDTTNDNAKAPLPGSPGT